MKVKQEKGNKERPGDGCQWDEGKIWGRSREDLGKIQGRSMDLGGSVFRSVGSGRRVERQGQQGVPRVRGIEGDSGGGPIGVLEGSVEDDLRSEEKRNRNRERG